MHVDTRLGPIGRDRLVPSRRTRPAQTEVAPPGYHQMSHWCRVPYESLHLIHDGSLTRIVIATDTRSTIPEVSFQWELYRPGWQLQTSPDGWHLVRHRGDELRFRLRVRRSPEPRCWDIDLALVLHRSFAVGFISHKPDRYLEELASLSPD